MSMRVDFYCVVREAALGRERRVIEHAHHFCVRLKYRKSGGG
jgi:hypothetical protein